MPFSQAENLGTSYQEQFPGSLIAKNVLISPKKMSLSCWIWSGTLLHSTNNQGTSRWKFFFTLHIDETVTAQTNKQMDLLIQSWSETDHEVKVKYFTSIMFGTATATVVVKEMTYALEKLEFNQADAFFRNNSFAVLKL